MSVQFPCLSFRQPYAGFILSGVKTVESRWRPLLVPVENCTLAIHIAVREWEGADWSSVLTHTLGLTSDQISAMVEQGERFGRGVVAGLVDVGETWQCPASKQHENTLQDSVQEGTGLGAGPCKELERAALLIGLEEKYLTRLSNPRWLKQPIRARGGRDLFTVEIPIGLMP